MADEVTIESLQAELAGAKARIKELNDESAGHRLNAKNARTEMEAFKLESDRITKEAAEKSAAADKATKEAGDRVNSTLRDAALRVAAKDAGIHDVDALKLFDTSTVKVGDDGNVSIPDDFFAKAKETKPYLFSATGKDTGNTSTTTAPPPVKQTGNKRVQDMTPEERTAAAKQLGIKL